MADFVLLDFQSPTLLLISFLFYCSISAFTAFGRNWTSSPDVLVSIMYKMVGESKKSWPNSFNQCMDIVVEHFALDPAKWGHLVATNADEENAQKW